MQKLLQGTKSVQRRPTNLDAAVIEPLTLQASLCGLVPQNDEGLFSTTVQKQLPFSDALPRNQLGNLELVQIEITALHFVGQRRLKGQVFRCLVKCSLILGRDPTSTKTHFVCLLGRKKRC